ncbi:MAG: TM2 domain-containing protein [Clostridia bacterium]|nr:TM2 domain-containing protein [Clostridia bacterium]
MFIISSAYPDLSVYLLSTVNLGIDIFLSVLSIILAVVLYISISKSVEQTISKSGVVNGEASDCTDNEALVSSKSKTVAALLCFFLGSLGIHRFYAGKMGTGFLWLFTAGLGGVGAFIDFFLIIFGSFKDSNGNNLG